MVRYALLATALVWAPFALAEEPSSSPEAAADRTTAGLPFELEFQAGPILVWNTVYYGALVDVMVSAGGHRWVPDTSVRYGAKATYYSGTGFLTSQVDFGDPEATMFGLEGGLAFSAAGVGLTVEGHAMHNVRVSDTVLVGPALGVRYTAYGLGIDFWGPELKFTVTVGRR